MLFLRFQRSYFLQVLLLLAILYIQSGCINDCNTSNRTGLTIGFQGADNKAKSLKFQMINEYNVRLDSLEGNEQANSIALPLDLSKGTTKLTFLFYYPDPATVSPIEEKVVFEYDLEPYSRGPECGIDVKVTNLSLTLPTAPSKLIDSVKVVNPDLTATKVSHVLIYISK